MDQSYSKFVCLFQELYLVTPKKSGSRVRIRKDECTKYEFLSKNDKNELKVAIIRLTLAL